MAQDDDDIDTSEISETVDFSTAHQGKYSEVEFRDYDVRSIANWCIAQARRENVTVTNLWLNKIVYFIYEHALLTGKILLTSARLEAWDHGPVFREIYFNFPTKNNIYLEKFDVRLRSKVIAHDVFESSDMALFYDVWRRLGHCSASRLRNLSHEAGSPWSKVWGYQGKVNPGMLIGLDVILGQETGQEDGRD